MPRLLSFFTFVLFICFFGFQKLYPHLDMAIYSFNYTKTHRTTSELAEFYKDQDAYHSFINAFNSTQYALVVDANSDETPLKPQRKISWHDFCEGDGNCIQPFIPMQNWYTTAPSHRLTTCLIHKSFSQTLAAITCFLDREHDFLRLRRNLSREVGEIRFCNGTNEFGRLEDISQHFNLSSQELSSWRMAAVVRDPVDRFLSGFIDRCISIRSQSDCFGCRFNMTCVLDRLWERAKEYSHNQSIPLGQDEFHLFPQNWRCDFQKKKNEYSLIRYSTDPQGSLLQGVEALLSEIGTPSSATEFIRSSMLVARPSHATATSVYRWFLENRLRRSPFLMEMLQKIFYHDFVYFEFSLTE